MEIACIVEGEGEKQALPLLVRRIVAEIDPSLTLRVYVAVTGPKSRLVKRGHLTLAVETAMRGLSDPGSLLILVDADDDCPVDLGVRLHGWAAAIRPGTPIAAVVANREYEAWFLAAAESLSGHRGLADDLATPPNAEEISGAKEWLSRRLPKNQPYSPTRHQASFSAVMDLEMARQGSSSFRKLCRDVQRLVTTMQASES